MKFPIKKHVISQFSLGITLLLLVGNCMPATQTEMHQLPTLTSTLLPTSITIPMTPTLSIAPTLVEVTPVNTMTTDERINYLTQFISDSGDCRLPCWWGITPGQRWEDAEKIIHELGGTFTPQFPGYDPDATVYSTYIIDGIPTNEIFIEEKDGLVYAWHINSTNSQEPEKIRRIWKNYSAQKIIKAYGMPGRILLHGNPATSSLYHGNYALWLFYDELGFSILYEALIPIYFFDAPFFRICSEIDAIINVELDMQSPENSLPLERFDRTFEQVRSGTDVGKTIVIRSLQEATGLNDTEIYEAFMEEKDPCLAIPTDIWRVK